MLNDKSSLTKTTPYTLSR